MPSCTSSNAPALLVINKIDTVEKDTLLEVIASYQDLYPFDACIPISAKRRDGLAGAAAGAATRYAVSPARSSSRTI